MARNNNDLHSITTHNCRVRVTTLDGYVFDHSHQFMSGEIMGGKAARLMARIKASNITVYHLDASPHWTERKRVMVGLTTEHALHLHLANQANG